MPPFVNSPFNRPILVTKGVAAYLLGTYDYKVGNTRLYVTNVAIAANVATVTVQLVTGPLPQVGGLISIIGTTTGTGEFNVSRATITGVNINATTGAGTITFALTGSNVSAADSGTVICEPPEVPETLANGASIACVMQAPDGDSQFTAPISVTFPTPPTAVTVTLQKALTGRDNNEWTNTTAAVAYASAMYSSGPVVEATLERGYLYRFLVSGLSGAGTVLAKIGG